MKDRRLLKLSSGIIVLPLLGKNRVISNASAVNKKNTIYP